MLAEELVASKVAAVVPGGSTPHDPVARRTRQIPDEALVVIVHDAARPLVDDAVIGRMLAPLAEGYDGVVPGLPVADTMKRVDRGVVAETIDRWASVTVQTPQAFTATALRAAFRRCVSSTEATDCASLVEARGGRVRVVAGDPRLLKITTKEDLALVASWL